MKKLLALLLFLYATVACAGQSSTFIFTPSCGLPQKMNEGTTMSDGTDGRMYCMAFTPCEGITNANQLAIRISDDVSVSGTQNFSIAYYDASGNYIVKATKAYTTNNTTVTYTQSGGNLTISGGGSSFTLTAGTYYYQCHCSSETSGGGTGLGINGANSGFASEFASNRYGYASNSCNTSTAVPPDTMGTLTQSAFPPLVVEVGTASP